MENQKNAQECLSNDEKKHVKHISGGDGAHLSIRREIGRIKEDLILKWFEKLENDGVGVSSGKDFQPVSLKSGKGKEMSMDEEFSEEEGGGHGGISAERKMRICHIAEISPGEHRSTSFNTHFYLPRIMRKLSRIFRALETIQRFNAERKLMTIFVKAKKCIESLIKQRVNVMDMERMYFIAPSFFSFKQISIFHDFEDVNTFIIHINGDSESFDGKLLECTERLHDKFLKNNGLFRVGRFHPKFDIDETMLSRKPLFSFPIEEKVIEARENPQESEGICLEAETIGKKRALSVLERIQEKEKRRKEEFVKKCKEEDGGMLIRKIQSLFTSEKKSAMPVSKIVNMLKIFDGIGAIRRSVKSKSSPFCIKVVKDIEYLLEKQK